jgi:hypothetical protein
MPWRGVDWNRETEGDIHGGVRVIVNYPGPQAAPLIPLYFMFGL